MTERANSAEAKLTITEKQNISIMHELVKTKQKYANLKEILRSKRSVNKLSISNESSLHVLPTTSPHDQTFIRKVIKIAYKTTPEILPILFLSQRKTQPGVETYAMSDDMCLTIKNVFSRRLRKCKLREIQYDMRMKKFKMLIRTALSSIRNEYKKKN